MVNSREEWKTQARDKIARIVQSRGACVWACWIPRTCKACPAEQPSKYLDSLAERQEQAPLLGDAMRWYRGLHRIIPPSPHSSIRHSPFVMASLNSCAPPSLARQAFSPPLHTMQRTSLEAWVNTMIMAKCEVTHCLSLPLLVIIFGTRLRLRLFEVHDLCRGLWICPPFLSLASVATLYFILFYLIAPEAVLKEYIPIGVDGGRDHLRVRLSP